PSPTSTATATATATFTPTPTPSPTATCSQYTITAGAGTIVPGTTDTGSHCDDCITAVALPFPFQLYGNTYSSVNLSSNGNAQFVTVDSTFVSVCVPWAAHDFTIFPLFQDLRTDASLSGCSGYPGGSCGIFTSISGTAPNRIFNIEWRAVLFGNNASRENFELRIYENSPTKRFDVVYGEINGTGASQLWSAGVQDGAGFFTSDFCNVAGNPPAGNRSRSYNMPSCGPTPTASPTPTATNTPTPSATASPSCTPSAGRVLIAYADIGGPPTTLRNQILAEPGVTAVDLFDAFSGTPTLAQLQQYNLVFAFSNNGWNNATAMGDVLANYQDVGGVVVVGTFAWDNRGPWLLAGRWITGG